MVDSCRSVLVVGQNHAIGKSRGSNAIWMHETACHKSPQRIQLPLSTEFLLLLLQLLDLLLLLKLLQLLVSPELI
jgi:hypothetical protein